jgi:hypothetical protein
MLQHEAWQHSATLFDAISPEPERPAAKFCAAGANGAKASLMTQNQTGDAPIDYAVFRSPP